jgi:hypothetical protein
MCFRIREAIFFEFELSIQSVKFQLVDGEQLLCKRPGLSAGNGTVLADQ